MTGIYIHIPFCRKVCSYCDFHFTVSLKKMDDVICAVKKEIMDRKHYLGDNLVQTIYIGGGTPSLLKPRTIDEIIQLIYKLFKIAKNPEITIEMNPDDMNVEYLKEIYSTGVNRISVGVQSFNNKHLKFLNRRHLSVDAFNAIQFAQDCGFKNINIDLLYGIPGMSLKQWKKNLMMAIKLDVQHVSAYHLTIEEKTVINYQLNKNMFQLPDERMSMDQYEMLIKILKDGYYSHYEISNFAKKGFESRHNIGYWTGRYYLGIGPSAHSYNGKTRRWNTKINQEYITSVFSNENYSKFEKLSDKEIFNEYLITHLRMVDGAKCSVLKNLQGDWYDRIKEKSIPFIEKGQLHVEGNKIRISEKYLLIADYIIRELMIE